MARTVFGSEADVPERFGLEVELFPLRWTGDGERPQHVPLRDTADGRQGSLPLVDAFAAEHCLPLKTPEGHVRGACPGSREGHITFEPGGQIEFSSAPHESPAGCYHETAEILDQLAAHLAGHGIELTTLGLNPWHGVDEIGLNTDAARYRCMDAVYQSIGEHGRRMMRQSATIHVNLDLGGPERGPRRWQAAQLLAPLALASFAFSPFVEERPSGFMSFRGRIWTDVDPSRTGFPPRFLAAPQSSPTDQYLDFALDARLLMLRRGDDVEAQVHPFPFRRWLAEGAYDRFPTLEDWSYHLTTLFPEVRPRGFLELRSADSQGRAFWSVPLTWWTALLCDDTALEQVLALLGASGSMLETRYLTAARRALSDPEIAEEAAALFRIATGALPRFPRGHFSDEMLRAFDIFGERFILAGRTPAEEFLEGARARGLGRRTLVELADAWRAAVGSTAASARATDCGND